MEGAAVISASRAGNVGLENLDQVSNAIGDVSASVSRFFDFSSDDMNRDSEIRDLLLRGDSSMDLEMRKSAYGRALALIADRAYVLPLYTLPTYYVGTRDLVVEPSADGILRFYEMSWK
jgi:peptide/nickel transport system substrate-binding protein